MNRVSRYLFMHVGYTTLLVALILTATVWLSQSLRLFDLLIDGGIVASTFLNLMLVTVPTFLGTVLPPALAIGVVAAYHRLNIESELVVMRAVGFSPWQLARPALLLSLLVAAAIVLLNFSVSPAAYRSIALQRSEAQTALSLLLREGVFTEIGSGRMLYVRERAADGSLSGILYHESPPGGPAVTVMARHGYMTQQNDQSRILVFDGNRQELDRSSGKVSTLYFERYTIDLDQFQAPTPRAPMIRERGIGELLALAGADPGDEVWAEIHRRVATPLTAPAIVAVVLAVLLAGEHNRRGQRGRLVVASLAILAVEVAMMGLPHIVSRSLSAAPALYGLPLLLVALGSTYLILSGASGRHHPVDERAS